MKYIIDIQTDDSLIINGIYNVVIRKKKLFFFINICLIGSFPIGDKSKKIHLLRIAIRYRNIISARH